MLSPSNSNVRSPHPPAHPPASSPPEVNTAVRGQLSALKGSELIPLCGMFFCCVVARLGWEVPVHLLH